MRRKQALMCLAKLWKFVSEQIKEIDKQIKEELESNELALVYESAPGIGPISSRILSSELGDMSQFTNERSLFSYTGLTPSEHSSGESRRLGHISRQGSARLRCLLVEASWIAIKKDEKLAEDFARISKRAGKKRAIVAIARKLIGRMRACFRTKNSYQLGHGLAA